MHDLFIQNLKLMDFDPTDKEFRSVVLVSEKNDPTLNFTQIIALEEAEKFKATAVYFRLFQDDRSPIPQIYIYDNIRNDLDDKKKAEIHRDLWSYCRIPMFIVIEKTDIKIYDARQPVKLFDTRQETGLFSKEISTNPIETKPIVPPINIASNAIKLYSRKLFDSGVFWESDQAKGRFLESKSAYNDLISGLKKVRKDFLTKTKLSPKIANKLLVFSILIKYLEERGNENKSLFAHDFFQKLGAENFCDVLRQKGKIIPLFAELSRHFNGRIFEWTDEERKAIEDEDLTQLAYFLDGDSNLETGQLFLDWRKYSFNHLPVELISSVYEEFLNERDDAVYTPEFLVNTLVDESMRLKEFKNLSVKTIDVSCGSGIFLVSVFKQLAQRHRYAEFKKTGELRTLKSNELLKIIKDNIFGVDIEEEAVRLAVFSLCLALCDELSPKEIWTELQFNDTFDTNFTTQNFFDYVRNESNFEKFDLVIGNPPFISLSKGKNSNYFKDENGNYFGEYREKNFEGKTEKKRMYVNEDIVLKSKQQIFPDNQTALMFLEQAPLLLKENGLLCLIMPAAPLLYNNSFEFRKHFFPKHQVYQIFDFTNLDEVLFEANVPTAAIFVRKQKHQEDKPLTHITIRRTRSVEDRIFFEIDKYDFHNVRQQSALSDKHVWKCNLLGGGRLHDLISRLSENQTVKNFINEQGWYVSEGYIVYRGNENRKGIPATYITGKKYLPASALKEDGIDEEQITTENAVLFEHPREEELYKPPLMLIKENIGKKKIPIHLSNEYLPFKSTIIGISASKAGDKSAFLNFYNDFKKYNSLLRAYISATSNQYLVTRGTLLYKQDLMNLPYPKDKEEMKLSFVEQILCDDVLEYYIQIKAKSSKAKMNDSAKAKNLKDFGEVFSKRLNSVYGKSGKYFYLKKIYDWGAFFMTEFNYGVNASDAEFEKIYEPSESVKSLIETEYGRNAFLIKTLKLYERNKIYLIKPKALRYWLRSIAIKDADEAFSDSIKAGY